MEIIFLVLLLSCYCLVFNFALVMFVGDIFTLLSNLITFV